MLAIDCGSTMTRVVLLDWVEGECCLVGWSQAPSTLGLLWNDMTVSVRHALEQLEEATGWHLLDERGQIVSPGCNGCGVDAVVAATSLGQPLRLVLTGITQGVSLNTARSALAGTCAVVEGTVSSNGLDGSVYYGDYEGVVNLLQELAPDAVVMVGGVDGGASEPVLQSARTLAWAYSNLPALQANRPSIVYAGNAELRTRVARILGHDADFCPVDNVCPSTERGNLQPLHFAVEELHRQHKMEELPGFRTLANWSSGAVIPKSETFAHTIRYLARAGDINVLGVDVGGATTTVATVVDDQLDLVVRRDVGLSHHAPGVLDHVPPESVSRWLPFEIDAAGVANELCNKALYPGTLPQTCRDLDLEQAVAREIMRLALAGLAPNRSQGKPQLGAGFPEFHLIIGSGGVLANAPQVGQAALMLLDGLQPVGVSSLALDPSGLLALLGAVARHSPLAAAQLARCDALLKLGAIVAPVGVAREGEIALTCTVHYEDGHSLEARVAYGSLEVIPLTTGQMAELELRPTRRFDIGLGIRGRARRARVEGGAIGIIMDARGRPLLLAGDAKEQQEKVQDWASKFS